MTCEYVGSRRLVLIDGPYVKFGVGGAFKVAPIFDDEALKLFENNRDEYLRCQITKLLENSLNQRIATQLLKQRQTDVQCAASRLN